jgi:hypothetical protein
MRETPRPDLPLAILPRFDSTAIEQTKVISTGSNHKFCCKSAATLFVRQG